jgi:hypothetical protein
MDVKISLRRASRLQVHLLYERIENFLPPFV